MSFVWQSIPLIQSSLFGRFAEPRSITPRGQLADDELATIELFEEARKGVVYISTAERVIDPRTHNIYKNPRGTGSGFAWDRLGHIVTNSHVVEGASGAIVRLAYSRSYGPGLVGTDPANDLAVLWVGVAIGRPPDLPIGCSADLRVGQKVFATGNPFGLD